MMENPGIGDNHNTPVFLRCYRRLGEFIPQLIHEGHSPRVMLEYSRVLLHGQRLMGAADVIDALRTIPATRGIATHSSTCSPRRPAATATGAEAVDRLRCGDLPQGHRDHHSRPVGRGDGLLLGLGVPGHRSTRDQNEEGVADHSAPTSGRPVYGLRGFRLIDPAAKFTNRSCGQPAPNARSMASSGYRVLASARRTCLCRGGVA